MIGWNQSSHGLLKTYFKFAKELTLEVSKTEEIEEKRELFEEFTNKFTAVPKIWENWQLHEEKHAFLATAENGDSSMNNKKEIFEKLKKKAAKHFIFENHFDDNFHYTVKGTTLIQEIFYCNTQYYYKSVGIKEMNFKFEDDFMHTIENDINSGNFEIFWDFVREFSTMEVSNKIKEKVSAAFDYNFALDRTLGSQKQWMEKVLQNDNNKLIILNIERHLRNRPFEKEIWDFYLEFLRTQESINILNVYSRYCRLFVDDDWARVEYFNTIINFNENGKNDVSKWWIDLINIKNDFESEIATFLLMDEILTILFGTEYNEFSKSENENDFGENLKIFKEKIGFVDAEKKPEEYLPPTSETKKPMLKFDCAETQNQNFALSENLIYYISRAAPLSIYKKLIQTCKYIYVDTKFFPIHKLSLSLADAPECYQDSIFLNMDSIKTKDLPKLFVSNSLFVDNVNYRYCIREIRPKLHHCDIKFLHLWFQRVKMDDFKFLTASGNSEKLHMNGSVIYETDIDSPSSLKDVLECIPKAKSLRFLDAGKTPQMPIESLSSVNHEAKIQDFIYHNIDKNFDAHDFCEFISQNAKDGAAFRCRFKFDLARNIAEEALKVINDYKLKMGRKIFILFQK